MDGNSGAFTLWQAVFRRTNQGPAIHLQNRLQQLIKVEFGMGVYRTVNRINDRRGINQVFLTRLLLGERVRDTKIRTSIYVRPE